MEQWQRLVSSAFLFLYFLRIQHLQYVPHAYFLVNVSFLFYFLFCSRTPAFSW